MAAFILQRQTPEVVPENHMARKAKNTNRPFIKKLHQPNRPFDVLIYKDKVQSKIYGVIVFFRGFKRNADI
jgi:hypothetical protein